MKSLKSYRLFTLAALTWLLIACDKNETDSNETSCYSCKIKVTRTTPSHPEFNDESISTMEVCMTQQEIQAYEKSGTFSSTSAANGFSSTVASETKCSK